MENRDSVGRLSEGEKVCLRQWLQHKSAKEIAAEIGISHHAVEKRLKMARVKLGATSSLEAARLLVEVEGYGHTVPQSPDLVADPHSRQSIATSAAIVGVAIMIFLGAIMLAVLQPATTSQSSSPGGASPVSSASAPKPGTELALRKLVAGLASGSPDYSRLSAEFGKIVRQDLPMTHPMFQSMGELRSIAFRGRGPTGDDVYDLKFARGEVVMSANLDADGKMAGGILAPPRAQDAPLTASVAPRPGTEMILRHLVAGLASGSPNYNELSSQFADVVRGDLPMTHPMFNSIGDLKSVAFQGRGPRGDDVYDLSFARGRVRMSVMLDAEGKMTGGILRPITP